MKEQLKKANELFDNMIHEASRLQDLFDNTIDVYAKEALNYAIEHLHNAIEMQAYFIVDLKGGAK